VVFLSSQSVKNLYDSYVSWAKANQWTLEKSAGYTNDRASLRAVKDNSSLLISLMPAVDKSGKSLANLFYVNK
jgi:hypothetical protein